MSHGLTDGRTDRRDGEVAAAVVALIAARVAASPPADPQPALWRDHTALLRAPLPAGPGAWRASARPH